MKKIFFSVLVLIGILSSAYFVLHNQGTDTKVSEVKKVKIGYLAIAGALPLFVANDNGYFHDEGLDVELVEFKSGNEMAIAASTKQIDIIAIGATNAVIDASETTGIKFKAFLLNEYTKKSSDENATDYLLVRKGVDFTNLKGKKVAFFPGSISKVFADLVLPKYGLTTNDIEYIEMAPPTWISALESGTIDAVTAIEPFAQQILKKGDAKVLIDGYYAEVMNDVPLSAGWFIENNLDKETENKIVNAYAKALMLIKTDRSKAIASFSNYTKISPDIYQTIGLNKWNLITDKGAEEILTSFIELLNKKNAVKDSIAADYIWKQ